MKHKHPQQKIADSKDRVGCLLFYGLDWLQEPSRRQRNPCAMLLAHGGGGEKSDRICLRLASCNRYQIMPPIDSQSTEGICFGAFSVELTAFHPRKPHASKSAAMWFLHYLVQALVLALVLAQSAASFS